jgi:hypothetical protein
MGGKGPGVPGLILGSLGDILPPFGFGKRLWPRLKAGDSASGL